VGERERWVGTILAERDRSSLAVAVGRDRRYPRLGKGVEVVM